MEFGTDNAEGSLADVFRQKKLQMLQSKHEEKVVAPKNEKKEKTKEELAEIRKQMMKPKASQNTTSSIE